MSIGLTSDRGFHKISYNLCNREFYLRFVCSSVTLFSAEPYRKPQKDVMDILNAPGTPTLSVNPTNSYALSATPIRYPSIAELAQPMHRIAGMRINPSTNGLHNVVFNSKLVLWKLPAGTQIAVESPPNAKLSPGRWSPDGTRFAFSNTTATRHRALDRRDRHGKDAQSGRRPTEQRHGAQPAAVDAEAAARRPAIFNGCPMARACWWRW